MLGNSLFAIVTLIEIPAKTPHRTKTKEPGDSHLLRNIIDFSFHSLSTEETEKLIPAAHQQTQYNAKGKYNKGTLCIDCITCNQMQNK